MVERPHKPSAITATPLTPQPQVDISADNTKVTAKLPSGESVEVLLYGAHVLSWKSHGRENIWMSSAAALDGSKAVRGGIPICFPCFGPPPKDHATSALKQHGFGRISKWEFLGKSTSEAGVGSVKLDFGLGPSNLSEESRKAWPYDFGLVYSVTLSKEGLQTMLNVRNEGKEAFEVQMLLHTYLAVNDISKTTISGLMGTTYVDKVLNATEHQETNHQLRFTGEVDRVYNAIKQDTTSVLEDGKPRFDVVRDNLSDTVVWNPWIEKAKGMGDFEPKDGYKKMVCVEVGSVDGWQNLEAGETFEAGQLMKALL